jgi:ubiquinone/menaquinone biosynthesis C-methylase UbiE
MSIKVRNDDSMNAEVFTGKAQAYAQARPSYPDALMDYIGTLAPDGAAFADVGAGTGKFAVLLARRGYTVFAVEPNADMRGQLALTLALYPNAKVVAGSAESTTLSAQSVDIVTCAQALHWFDRNAFWAECRRVGKPGGLVAAIYNSMRDYSGSTRHHKQATDAFFSNPTVREFSNPITYSRESWLVYMMSHSQDPLPSDPGYARHIAEANAVFDRENIDGLLHRDIVTRVYSEKLTE